MKVNIINKSQNPCPQYANPGDAGLDLRAELSTIQEKFMVGAVMDEIRDVLIIFSGGRALIPTENYMAIPEGYELQIRPRSGLALKNGVTVLNTPGTIDSQYRNGIGVILINTSDEPFEVEQSDRIAQAVLSKFETIEFNEVESLDDTTRGLTGFGDSGVK